MRRYDRPRARPARTGHLRSELTPVETTLSAAVVLAIVAWLLAHPLAAAVVLVALALAALFVGVPLAVVRGVLAVRAWRDRWHRDAVGSTREDQGVRPQDSLDRPGSSE